MLCVKAFGIALIAGILTAVPSSVMATNHAVPKNRETLSNVIACRHLSMQNPGRGEIDLPHFICKGSLPFIALQFEAFERYSSGGRHLRDTDRHCKSAVFQHLNPARNLHPVEIIKFRARLISIPPMLAFNSNPESSNQ
jgi:hypothetical protein